MERVVPWSALRELVEPVYPKLGNGRPRIGVERMLRIYVYCSNGSTFRTRPWKRRSTIRTRCAVFWQDRSRPQCSRRAGLPDVP
jgi:hypothetical protein